MKEAMAHQTATSPTAREGLDDQYWSVTGSDLNSSGEVAVPEISLQPPFQSHPDDTYNIPDLLQYHDRNFIENAYRAILKRSPDDAEYQEVIEDLRSGHLNKIDILAKLRFSEEGREKNVRIEGLLLPSLVRKTYNLPILGYLLQATVGIMRLPSMIRSQRRFEAHTLAQLETVVAHANRLGQGLGQFDRSLQTFGRGLQRALSDQAAANQSLGREVEQVSSELSTIRQQMITLSKDVQREVSLLFSKQQQTSSEVVLQNQRLTRVLEEIQKRPVAPLGHDELQVFAQEQSHALDALYASFDEEFRGGRQEIKERLRVYLPIVRKRGIGREATPILDVGCGRGEWLELLKDEGFQAVGVDSNSILVLQCRERGIEVVEADLMSYLGDVHDESLGAVTGFHIVEHLPVETLVAFLNETMRVLQPGGLVIFETPNPHNVLVGSCNFYFDPTHRNPLPSEVLKFLVESRGFERVEVLPLNPSDEAPVKGDSELVNRFNQYFYGPMDYGIVGTKPGANRNGANKVVVA